MNNKFKSRFQQKIGTTAEWDKAAAYGFVPLKGEIIIYQDFDTLGAPTPPQFKVGDGVSTLSSLPFSTAAIEDLLNNIECESVKVGSPSSYCQIDTMKIDGSQSVAFYTYDSVTSGQFSGSRIRLDGGAGRSELTLDDYGRDGSRIITRIYGQEADFGGSIHVADSLVIGSASLNEETLTKLLAIADSNLATDSEVYI